MNLLDAAAILLLAGYGTVEPFDAGELDEAAFWLVQACESDTALPPTGGECLAVTASLWAVESARAFLPYPTGRWRGSGEGPMQLARPTDCWHSSASGRWCWPHHEVLGGAASFVAAVALLRLKWGRFSTTRSRLASWNGGATPGYDTHALGIYRAIEAAR